MKITAPFKALKQAIRKFVQDYIWRKKLKAHQNINVVGKVPLEVIDDRDQWVNALYKIVHPVISHLAAGTLKKNMPKEKGAQYFMNIEKVTYLEALGRTIAGVAPWLALPDDSSAEGVLRRQLRAELLLGLANSVNPDHVDYLSYREETQCIVDAAYVAHGFLRARAALWAPLDKITQQRFIAEFKSLRTRFGAYNNWLLFAAVIEVFLLAIDEDYDPARIHFAINKMNEWYVGDGWYSDGPSFSMDYYNSFVIHPMLVDALAILVEKNLVPEQLYQQALNRLVRHAVFLERMIMPDGSYPPIGRSITYRTGAFQALAQAALNESLPPDLAPGQVRSALTKVIAKMYAENQNFDANGWLVLGFNGYQPRLADTYTSTGSLYMASLVFLPLGLPSTNEFWSSTAASWTSTKAWTGLDVNKDYKVEY